MKPLLLLLCGALLFTTASGSQQKKSTKKGKTSVTQHNGSHGLVVIETSMGNITVQLADDKAPKHAANFRKLAKEGFYVGTTFHRVIPGFMIQGGDPNSRDSDRSNDGLGGPGYTIDAEIGLPHDRGVIAAARQGDEVNPQRKSNGSQFYITVAPAHFLDGQYSVFGKVVKGMDVVDKIVAVPRDRNDNPIQKVVIKKVLVK
ncbi:MAG TPA: peptidylprolyl isomerase [Bacteroidota bacterium]|nr:peptidylprolyl isomerase [Bacteroidota bacterium]